MYRVLNAEMLKSRFSEDRDVLRNFLQSFLVDLDKDLSELGSAVKSGQKERVFFFSHKIKGLISIFQDDAMTLQLVSLQNSSSGDLKHTEQLFYEILHKLSDLKSDVRLFLQNEFSQKIRNILLIDDNSAYLKMQTELLTKRGFNVLSLQEMNNINTFIEEQQIKVVLLDIVMPEIDGLSLLKKIRQQYGKEDVSVIMLTAIEDKEVIKKSHDLGANEFLNKSATIDLITLRVNLQFVALEHKFVLSKYEFLEEEHRKLKSCYQEMNTPLMTLELNIEELQGRSVEKPIMDSMHEAYKKIEKVMEKVKKINGIIDELQG